MIQRGLQRIAIAAAMAAFSGAVLAQIPTPTAAYTVTWQLQFAGPKAVIKTWRLGSKMLVEQTNPPGPNGNQSETTRTLYNLDTQETFAWNPLDPSAPCARGRSLPPEWQNLFSGGPALAMKDVAHVGQEKILGIDAVILESAKDPDTTKRLWVDPQTGLMLKAQFISKKLGETLTYLEVTEFSLTPPPASILEIPAACRAMAALPQPPQ